MTRPTARVLALLEILQSGGVRTVPDLAGRLGVDERTVRRYAAHLADLGIPVESRRGRYGGYLLAPGYKLPPLMFTDEEALAVLLGLVAGRRSGLVAAAGGAADSAAAKIRRVLPPPLSSRLEAVLSTTDFTGPARPATSPGTDVLLVLAECARRGRPVSIAYTSWKGSSSERVLHPYGLVFHSGRWYVTGADSASGEVRTFRLDRIGSAVPTLGSFEVPPGFQPVDRVLAGLADVRYAHEVSVLIRAPLATVRERIPASVAKVAEVDGGVRLTLRAARLDWAATVLAWIDCPFVVERPAALRDEVRALAARLAVGAAARPDDRADADPDPDPDPDPGDRRET